MKRIMQPLLFSSVLLHGVTDDDPFMYYTYYIYKYSLYEQCYPNLPTTGIQWKPVLTIVAGLVAIASIFELTGIVLWITMGVVVANPPNGSKWMSCYVFVKQLASLLSQTSYNP